MLADASIAVTMKALASPDCRRTSGLRWAELLLAFGALPPALGFLCPRATWIPVLWAMALAAAWSLWRGTTTGEPATEAEAPQTAIGRILVRFGSVSVVMVGAVWLWRPEILFSLPRHQLPLWLLIMVLYPLLSVYPQELLFRRWFFQRYATVLGDGRFLVAANALLFGWAHVVMQNGLAIALTVAGGWLLADTYRRSRSLWLVCLEHALYGDLIFTIGLGHYFYHGAVR